jgi:hypothetical protein
MADPPTPQWPKVDDGKGHSEIDKDRVKSLLKALDDDLKRYEGQANYAGTPDGLDQTLGNITSAHVGGGGDKSAGYPGGQLIWNSIQKTKAGFSKEYSQFLQDYRQVVDALYRAAGIRHEADTKSTPTTTTTSQQPSGSQSSYDNGSAT